MQHTDSSFFLPAATGVQPLLRGTPVMPVVAIDNPDHAVPLARALLDGGIRTIEITLRTPQATEAIKRVLAEVDGMTVGAGTLTRSEQVAELVDTGVAFAATPGTTTALLNTCRAARLPILPGVSTVSEAMAAREMGYSVLKLFPAHVLGGIDMLKSLQPVLPDLLFCPTGGVRDHQISEYLSLTNVIAIGSSWVCPREIIADQRWSEISRRARFATAQSDGTANEKIEKEGSHAHRD